METTTKHPAGETRFRPSFLFFFILISLSLELNKRFFARANLNAGLRRIGGILWHDNYLTLAMLPLDGGVSNMQYPQ
ncbi:hypothetical protein BDQ94DRAFT_108303 [Aspergillus welwitschiae]|uniref:Uncharacterized protein n=1 Tax=Aspergillus welwitschiae TaxID=1341132 RepID=A0A3F3PM33_9EURO|nr:hypothetical protein BDQ94DRAFT_108303 [Aspergillus welwitschiae]RDH27903.1 hypothetical protein BDQ94DRAFT_108303 [Aspergillus welwitschiae]